MGYESLTLFLLKINLKNKNMSSCCNNNMRNVVDLTTQDIEPYEDALALMGVDECGKPHLYEKPNSVSGDYVEYDENGDIEARNNIILGSENDVIDSDNNRKYAYINEGVLNLDPKYFTPEGNQLATITVAELQKTYGLYSEGVKAISTNKTGFINQSVDYFAVEGNTLQFEYRFALADYVTGIVTVYSVVISAVDGNVNATSQVEALHSYNLNQIEINRQDIVELKAQIASLL